jgi:hypothetical protein
MVHHTIYSASDGSVLTAGTRNPSSTFDITIDLASINVSHKGKITIRQGEESSLRVEIEGLIQAYYLIHSNIPRGTPLTVIHTLSHLEHSETADNDLRERREALATADAVASEADDTHTLSI